MALATRYLFLLVFYVTLWGLLFNFRFFCYLCGLYLSDYVGDLKITALPLWWLP